MARASRIYVLSQYGAVFGTFTVKQELISAAQRKLPPHLWSEYRVHVYLDGCYGMTPALFTLPEFMK